MISNLKASGLALVAAFVVSTTFASTAFGLQVTATQYPAILKGESIEHHGKPYPTLTTSGGVQVTCGNLSTEVVLEKSVESMTVIPNYEKCEAKIGAEALPITINMTGCDYFIHGGVQSEEGHFIEGTVDLTCPEGVTGPDLTVYQNPKAHAEGNTLCLLTIDSATNLKESTAVNTAGTPDDLLVESTITTQVKRDGSLLCGAANQTAVTTGSGTVKAYEDVGGSLGNQIGVTISE